MGDYGFEGTVVADQLEGGVRADFRDWVKVVAAKEDAEVDELEERVNEFVLGIKGVVHLKSGMLEGEKTVFKNGISHTCFRSIARPSRTRSR